MGYIGVNIALELVSSETLRENLIMPDVSMRPTPAEIEQSKKDGYMTGQLLIAMPQMRDSFFARSLVYVCIHNAEGAMGIVINKPLPSLKFGELLSQLEIESADEALKDSRVHFGGPVETARGFVLHSKDYQREDTLTIDETFAVTTTVEVLKDIADNSGPGQSFVALGYAGWSPGQLDAEIQSNGWLNVDPDAALVFESSLDDKWKNAMTKLGVSIDLLTSEAGEA